MSNLFSFQGRVMIGERSTAGKLIKPEWVGNVPECTLALTTENSKKTESFSGNRLDYGLLKKATSAELSLTFDEWLANAMALALYSEKINTAGSTVTGEALPDGVTEGDLVKLTHPFISALTIMDSTGTPVAVPFTIDSPNAGLIKIGDLAGKTAPYNCAYTYASADSFAMFAKTPTEKYVLLDGINTEDNSPVLVHMYRVKFDPVSNFGLIHEDYGNLPMKASLLYDPINAANTNFGGFARIERKSAV